jgi:pescadillo protein
VHERRVRKAAAKQQLSLARRLIAAKPGYKLDHLVKER